MSRAIENLQKAPKRALAIGPRVGGFPYLAETLRRAGVTRNLWFLPAWQSIFLTNDGPVVSQGTPLVDGITDVPVFDRAALVSALRTDQAGESTFPEFLAASSRAGVVRYEVDFSARTVAYYACNDELYIEAYPSVSDGLITDCWHTGPSGENAIQRKRWTVVNWLDGTFPELIRLNFRVADNSGATWRAVSFRRNTRLESAWNGLAKA